MIIDCNEFGPEPLEYESICEAFADNRIVKIKLEDDGRFRVREQCDNYFAAYLTADQLIIWGRELIDMAERRV